MVQVALSSGTYLYLKHWSGHGNQSEKAFSSPITKAGCVEADAEMHCLGGDSKEIGKKR